MRLRNFLSGLSTITRKQTTTNIICLSVHLLAPISIKVKDYIIKNSDNEKLLGVTVDTNLNFICHLENILKKANKMVHALARITPYLSIPKRKLLMNSSFTSQFNYCPLTWMCYQKHIYIYISLSIYV